MKIFSIFMNHFMYVIARRAAVLGVFACLLSSALAAQPDVILDENGVNALGLETAVAEESDFEETTFALGRIEENPQHHAVLSSRIAGRIVEVKAFVGEEVQKGDVLVRVESRQPGDPPPVIDLKSPISGLVTESHIRQGEPVEPDKELLDMADLKEVWAVARVPEHQAGKLKPGMKAHIRVAALGDTAIQGELLRFGTTADRESGTIDAVFKVSNPDLKMRAGMRAEFSIIFSKREGVISVPREALQGDANNRVVYVRDFDLKNAFYRTPVKVGQMNDRRVEIVSGLLPSDEVVTKGSYSLGFAGGSGPSLKEALDAAHGHEHNEDGSEKTDAQKKADQSKGHDHEHGDHEEGGSSSLLTRFFMGTTALLFVLLVVVSFAKRQPKKEEETETPDAH